MTDIANITISNDIIIPHFIEEMNNGHTVTFRPKGRSMRPFLEDGRDKVVLKKATEINIGDVVLAEVAKGTYVLHRVVNVTDGRVILRGDGNINTENCTLDDIHGTAVAFYRKGRRKPDYTTGMKWRIYSALWTRLLPLRRYLLYAYRVTTNKH